MFSLLVFRHALWMGERGVVWGWAFKTLCGPDGRTESVQGWIYSVSQKAQPQAMPPVSRQLPNEKLPSLK